ncbi:MULTISPECIES: zf-TFIIB domain-containing protein [unclassified Polaromonas]|uniref:TFIIB-type zinc ribbon-containing protein n=1 Tax=unclassified Polaromonas TaxID=2638319 RepID=UPI000BD41C96|nr:MULTISPECIES: zf-TFIIB domain-containing protein [unclassified Polaromonas]MDP3137066.1 zf-TFIIB domain-containing protein [Burkholderiaceae bacterium]OYY32210.1 MAG: hypothetical protein B7Y60_23190 [Polaromonas sp. 35-63-35]OYZ14915.1 MAG: hypothetical protein B7Y28_23195 [Polaromonas sp. 16-63-31]OYZ75564.1 MAG: hypothetical protein B7Y09_23800 [Polaromonas sp. 24-63-21]OZA45935.1 MAG: hypothetical protein B7X88_23970 [Polaromonas sp. 17-63-33]
MKCPTCPDSVLTMSERQGVEIDYCSQCRGVWLDRGELDKLIELSAGPVQSMQDSRPRHTDFESRDHRRRRKSWLGEIFD